MAREASRDAIDGDVDQNHVGSEGLRLAEDGIVRRQGQSGVGAHGARHAGPVHQDLKHGALIIVGGEYGY